MTFLSLLILFFTTLIVVDSPHRLRVVLLVAMGSVMYASLHLIREWQKYGGMAAGYRPGWVAGDPNYFSLSVLLCLPLGFYLLRSGQPLWERRFCYGFLALALVSLTLAASRGAFLSLIVMLLFGTLRARRPLYHLAILTAVLLPLMILSPASPLERLLHPSRPDDQAADSRTALWAAGLKMIASHPLVGIGASNFKAMAPVFGSADAEINHVAHNTYIEIAAETGLGGIGAFLGVLIATFATLERIRRRPRLSDPPLTNRAAEALQVGLVGYAVAIFFLSAQSQKLFWLFVFLSIVLRALAARAARSRPPGEQRHPSGTLPAVGGGPAVSTLAQQLDIGGLR